MKQNIKLQKHNIQILIPVFYMIAGTALCVLWIFQTEPRWWQIVGTLLAVISFALWIIARIQLGKNFTIGAHANALVTTGLYSKLSHPVYYFSITALAGIALTFNHSFLFLLVGLLIILEVVRIRKEEKVLRMKFGVAYQKYKDQVWL